MLFFLLDLFTQSFPGQHSKHVRNCYPLCHNEDKQKMIVISILLE